MQWRAIINAALPSFVARQLSTGVPPALLDIHPPSQTNVPTFWQSAVAILTTVLCRGLGLLLGTASAGDSPISHSSAVSTPSTFASVAHCTVSATGADTGEPAVPTVPQQQQHTTGGPKLSHITQTPTRPQAPPSQDPLITPPSTDKLLYAQRSMSSSNFYGDGDLRHVASPLRRRASLLSPKRTYICTLCISYNVESKPVPNCV